jgi:hypothetical protein
MSEAAADSLRAYVSAPARVLNERERQPGERPGVADELEVAGAEHSPALVVGASRRRSDAARLHPMMEVLRPS